MNNTMTIATADGRTVATTIEGLERAVDVMKRVATSAGPDEGKYSEAPEVQRIAARLISDETRLGHLAEARVSYLLREGPWISKGSVVMGKVYVMDERARFNTGLDAQVIINRQVWDEADETQQEALVAHELCHIEKDVDNRGRSRYWLANHDLEEFSWIVRRYGIWDDSLRKFFAAFENGETERKQLSLFEGGAAS